MKTSAKQLREAKQKVCEHPLFLSGVIFVDGREYVGKASDGTEVSLGQVDEEVRLLSYLENNSDPSKW